jgi:hypothetical protein
MEVRPDKQQFVWQQSMLLCMLLLLVLLRLLIWHRSSHSSTRV